MRIMITTVVLLIAVGLVSCGSQVSAPSAEIPAPITGRLTGKITVTAPDSSGNVTVAGSTDSVPAESIVTVYNVDASGADTSASITDTAVSALPSVCGEPGYACTTADIEGEFQMIVAANKADPLVILALDAETFEELIDVLTVTVPESGEVEIEAALKDNSGVGGGSSSMTAKDAADEALDFADAAAQSAAEAEDAYEYAVLSGDEDLIDDVAHARDKAVQAADKASTAATAAEEASNSGQKALAVNQRNKAAARAETAAYYSAIAVELAYGGSNGSGGGGGGGSTTFAAFVYGIYAANDVRSKSGSSIDVTGDLLAGNSIVIDGGTIDVTGTSVSPHSEADTPDADMDYWETIASESGVVFAGNHEFSAGTYDGIYYVGGHVTISSDVTINGSIIAEGKINIDNSSTVTITAADGDPALVTHNNTILVDDSSDVTVAGWVVSGGRVNVYGGSTMDVTGGVATKLFVELKSSSTLDVTYDASRMPTAGFSDGEEVE